MMMRMRRGLKTCRVMSRMTVEWVDSCMIQGRLEFVTGVKRGEGPVYIC